MIRLALLVVVVFGFMLVEARRAASNERAQRARGGIEPKYDVYPAMQVAYPGIFLAMIGEGLFHPEPSRVVLVTGVVVFILGKLLKWCVLHGHRRTAVRARGHSVHGVGVYPCRVHGRVVNSADRGAVRSGPYTTDIRDSIQLGE